VPRLDHNPPKDKIPLAKTIPLGKTIFLWERQLQEVGETKMNDQFKLLSTFGYL